MIAALNILAGLVLSLNGQVYNGGGRTVDYLVVQGSNITVSDLRVRGSGLGTNTVSVHGNNNVLRRLLVERSGATGVYFYDGTGHVLEDSVIRDPQRRQGLDSWAIYSAAQGVVTIRRNFVYGSGFSTRTTTGSSIIEDNSFVVPDDYRTDCNGAIDREGPCQCAEFGIALKSGNSIIRRNTIIGYRRADPNCGGSGTPGAGIAIAACGPAERPCPTNNVFVDGNTIRDAHAGVYVSPGATNVRITYNRLCRSDVGISDGYGSPSTILANQFYGNRQSLDLYGSRSGMVASNIEVTNGGLCGSFVP